MFFSVYLAVAVSHAQDLAPRAYIITPIHSNAITLTYSFFDGNLAFEGTLPITGANASAHVAIFNYSHSYRLFGRTANLTASLPYGVGNFRGTVVGLGWAVLPENGTSVNGLPRVERSLDWIRLAARFPVRIRIDDPDDSFRIGASAVATVHGSLRRVSQ